ncbi:MAG: hypothetical protein K2O33_02960, partial [Muribaculaceae bacterium]|nr:hypothetical protein [Muribaculaceae bacterium]
MLKNSAYIRISGIRISGQSDKEEMNKFYLLAFLLPAPPIAAQARLGLNDRVQLGEMLAASKAAKGVSEIQE